MRLAAVMEAATVTGPAKNLLEFCRLASASGDLEPLLFTYVREGDLVPNRFLTAAEESGLRIIALRERSRFDRGVIDQLRTHLDNFRPDILQTHNPKSHFYVRYSGLDRRWPWVAFHHGYTTPDFKMRLYNQVNRWSLRAPRRVITVCRPFVDLLASHGTPRDRIRVLHNSVRPPQPSSTPPALETGVPQILAVGRLSQEKGQADLIRALVRIPAPARLLLLGDGPDRESLEALAQSLHVADRIDWAGHQPSAQPFYETADLLALPSLSEGSPNVILEAMAAGLPIAATSVGGVPELLTHGEHALLVPPRDPAAMAQAILTLLGDPDLARRLGDRARERSAHYTPERYAESLLAIYREAIER